MIYIEKNNVSEQEDLVTDLVLIIDSIYGYLYDKRSVERRKKRKIS